MNLTSCVNEKRLFSKLPNFFDCPSSILLELAQNAQRSSASMFEVRIDGNTLTASDNGCGCSNPEALFVLASSDWSPEVEAAHDPAGWGGLFLITVSDRLTYRSRFGSITFDCSQYLNSVDYRSAILEMVDSSDTCEGFFLSATLKKDLSHDILSDTRYLRFFPLDITINGKSIERSTLKQEVERCNEGHLSLTFEGNDLYVEISSTIGADLTGFRDNIALVWYGIPINIDEYTEYTRAYKRKVLLDVSTGSPLTPILPIRKGVKEDEKLASLYSFVRNSLVAHCIGFINNPVNQVEGELIKRSEIMSKLASQEEIDMLDRFFVSLSEPHHDYDNYRLSCNKVIIGRCGPLPVSEFLESIIFSDTGEVINPEDTLVLPPETIVEVSVSERCPSWLVIEKKGCKIHVDCTKASSSLNYEWIHGFITCEGKEIKSLAMIEGWSNGVLVYSDKPGDIWPLQQAIFQRHLYSDDFEADSYASQELEFESELDNDISRLTNSFRKRDLFDGFRSIGINIGEITNIAVKKKAIIIKMRDGKVKTLKIAA